MPRNLKIYKRYKEENRATLYLGDTRNFLKSISPNTFDLILTSPPYNIGKEYEKQISIDEYYETQKEIIGLCIDRLKENGNICWQVGNYVDKSRDKTEVIPLDILLYPIFKERGLQLRNRIVWHFGHGLHSRNRFSGRHETILWFSKSDNYTFNLDPVRIEQKYPGKKAFKGPNKGKPSGHPDGKNPSDVWDIPNVKANHKEKTIHECQFPISLVDRLVKSLTSEGELVFDPFLGVGSTTAAAVRLNRRVAGSEIMENYYKIAAQRTKAAYAGTLPIRDDIPPYTPPKNTLLTIHPFNNQK